MSSFWFDHPQVLLDNAHEFVPMNWSSYPDNSFLNALVRFSIITSLVIVLYTQDVSWIAFPVLIMIGTVVLTKYFPTQDTTVAETFDGMECRFPTQMNPYMNPLPYDLNDKPPCNPLDETVHEQIVAFEAQSTFRDDTDVYAKDLPRDFYTLPDTSPAAYGKYLDWVVGRSALNNTCKTNPIFCQPSFRGLGFS